MTIQRTNVMRILDQKKIPYQTFSYPHGDSAVDGITVSNLIGKPAEQVFKTLVVLSSSKKNYVFVIPVCAELDLKKAAKAVGEKSISMVPVANLLNLTGYVRGGCSPIGMKKQFSTFIHSSGTLPDTIIVSAGKIGVQVELNPLDLIKLINAKIADVINEE